jgi:hypothetical protein
MASYFSADNIAKLQRGRQDVRRQFRELQGRYIARTYRSDRAREYALQGFCRRLDCLARAVDFVFTMLPPERDDIPDTDDVVAATMLIQSFVVNASGCLDNLAWIWVYETDLREKNGKKINPRRVGLGEGYSYLRNSFAKPFRNYLRGRKSWFRHLSEFRDTLAHRIPLYIPPSILSDADAARYRQLEQEMADAIKQGDYEKFDQLGSDQRKLGRFLPWMTHSQTEKSPMAVFHWQLLQDYATIDELGRKMLDELADFEQRQSDVHKGALATALKQPRIWYAFAGIAIVLGALFWALR